MKFMSQSRFILARILRTKYENGRKFTRKK